MPENTQKPLIVQQDTTKAGIKAIMDKAGADRKEAPYSAKAMRLALFRFIANSFGDSITPEQRQAAWKAFDATPAWFGTNNSAARQSAWADSKAPAEAELESIVA